MAVSWQDRCLQSNGEFGVVPRSRPFVPLGMKGFSYNFELNNKEARLHENYRSSNGSGMLKGTEWIPYSGRRSVLSIYDALYDAKDITHIWLLMNKVQPMQQMGMPGRQEKWCSDCYIGSGSCNTVTGIAQPTWIRYPWWYLPVRVASSPLWARILSGSWYNGVTAPITKHNYIVKDAARLPDIIRKLFR